MRHEVEKATEGLLTNNHKAYAIANVAHCCTASGSHAGMPFKMWRFARGSFGIPSALWVKFRRKFRQGEWPQVRLPRFRSALAHSSCRISTRKRGTPLSIRFPMQDFCTKSDGPTLGDRPKGFAHMRCSTFVVLVLSVSDSNCLIGSVGTSRICKPLYGLS